MKKINTAVFISGTGSNLLNLIKFSRKKKSPINIIFILSNKTSAKGLHFAKKFKIQKQILNFKNSKKAEEKLISFLNKKKIKLVCLAGFMKILSKEFIRKFKGKIINIHPSYLPKYKGLNTHRRVIKNGEKYTGCTVHFVTTKLDSGKIIIQKKVKILKNDNEISLAKRVLKSEHKIYPLAIRKISLSL